MEANENIQESPRNKAITEVTSSMKWDSVELAMWSEVITKRQNPKRLADVPRICCEVLFAI